MLNAFRPRERGRAMGIYASLTMGALSVAVALAWTALALHRQEVVPLVPGYVIIARRGLVQTTRQVGPRWASPSSGR